MNLAYLILAHNQPAQLLRLVNRLNQPNAHFFIHIDRKSKDQAAFKELLSGFSNVNITSVYNINWMGFNMVLATLHLMRMAVESGINFKYFILMSGQDYPIRTNEQINQFFASRTNDFISYDNVNYMAPGFGTKIKYFHFMDIPWVNPRSPQKKPSLVYLYFGLHKKLRKYFPARKFYKNYTPFFGSQWFALTDETSRYILRFTENHKDYCTFMKHTEGPDELFFQTLILNSERASNVYDYQKYTEFLKVRKEKDFFMPGYSSLRYMDWSERGKSKPAVLDMSYFETLKNENYLFARKVDEKISAELLDKIDKVLLKEK